MSALTLRAEHHCHGGRVRFYTHLSEQIGGAMRLGVFLPPQAEHGPVPALIYLAGLTCTEETFLIKAGALRLAAELGIALVAPDTSPREKRYPGDDEAWDFGLGAGFYVDATEAPWRDGYRMYSYITQELPALLTQALPLTDRFGIFGHSMGGHGALVAALRNPDRFVSVSAFAPIAAPSQCPWGQKAFSGYLGQDRDSWAAYDATELIKGGARCAPILIDQGLNDAFLAEQLHPQRFEDACAAAGQALTLRRHAAYDHGYYFIQSFIEEHLRHHAALLLG